MQSFDSVDGDLNVQLDIFEEGASVFTSVPFLRCTPKHVSESAILRCTPPNKPPPPPFHTHIAFPCCRLAAEAELDMEELAERFDVDDIDLNDPEALFKILLQVFILRPPSFEPSVLDWRLTAVSGR